MKDKLIECPNYLGQKEIYSRKTRKVHICTTCKGEGVVIEDEYNSFVANLV